MYKYANYVNKWTRPVSSKLSCRHNKIRISLKFHLSWSVLCFVLKTISFWLNLQKHRENTFGPLTRAADPCFKRSPRFPRFSTIFYSLLAYTLPRYAVTFYSDWTLTRKWMLITKNRKSGQSNWAFRNPVTGSSQGRVSVHPHQIRSSSLETKLSSRDYLNIALFFILHIPHSWDVWFSVSYPFHNGSSMIPLTLTFPSAYSVFLLFPKT